MLYYLPTLDSYRSDLEKPENDEFDWAIECQDYNENLNEKVLNKLFEFFDFSEKYAKFAEIPYNGSISGSLIDMTLNLHNLLFIRIVDSHEIISSNSDKTCLELKFAVKQDPHAIFRPYHLKSLVIFSNKTITEEDMDKVLEGKAFAKAIPPFADEREYINLFGVTDVSILKTSYKDIQFIHISGAKFSSYSLLSVFNIDSSKLESEDRIRIYKIIKKINAIFEDQYSAILHNKTIESIFYHNLTDEEKLIYEVNK